MLYSRALPISDKSIATAHETFAGNGAFIYVYYHMRSDMLFSKIAHKSFAFSQLLINFANQKRNALPYRPNHLL